MLKRGQPNFSAVQQQTNASTQLIRDNLNFGQTFISQEENLNEIRVRITTRALKINGGLVLHLTLAKSPEMDIITSTRLFKDTVIEEWMAFKFPPIQDSKEKKFYFYLTTLGDPAFKNVRLGRFEEDNYKQGQLMLNGRPQKGDLSFVALKKNEF